MAAEPATFADCSSVLRSINSLILDGAELPPVARDHAITVLTTVCVLLEAGLPHPAGVYLLCDAAVHAPSRVTDALSPEELSEVLTTLTNLFDMLASHTL